MLDHNWHPVDDPATPAEAEALDRVRALLPDDPLCHAWTNLTFSDHTGHLNEVDLLLLIRQGLFVVELKGWHGKVTGRINDWQVKERDGHPEHQPNPLNLTNKKAQRLKGLLKREVYDSRHRVRLPYIAPVVVMHGRGSHVELSSETRGPVFGLDGFAVRGVPNFTELLKTRGRERDLDKVETDALVRLVRNSGLAPRLAHARPDEITPPPVESELTRVPAVAVDRAVGQLFADLADEQLHQLGVAADFVAAVRGATDIESLIGRLPDDVWDDLEAVAGGEAVDVVVERRRGALRLFAEVTARASEVGWEPPDTSAAAPVGSDVAAPASAAPEDPAVSDLERRLREAFGDKVTSRKATPPGPKRKTASTQAPKTGGQRAPSEEPRIPSETLLTLSRTEAMAGRLEGAQRLHGLVRERIERDYSLDWTLEEVLELSRALRTHALASHRLEQMVLDLREGRRRAPVVSGVASTAVGDLWSGSDLGPVYSLLVRVPDVLDRSSGLFLSQVIGPQAAARVNARLREGRPDGGRIRIVEDGTVVSRRDADSPWFVVGHVSVEEWFPGERIVAA